MKQIALLLAAIAIAVSARGQGKQTSIGLNIDGLGDGRVSVDYTVSPDHVPSTSIDTVASNGRLVLYPQIGKLNLVLVRLPQVDSVIYSNGGASTLHFAAGNVEFPIMPGDAIEITGRVNGRGVEATIAGSEAARVTSQLRERMFADLLVQDSLFAECFKFDDEGWFIREMEKYYAARYPNPQMYPPRQWLAQNPCSPVAGYVMYRHLAPEVIIEEYPALIEMARTGIYGELLDRKLGQYFAQKENGLETRELKAGDDAPRFTLETVDGGRLSLTDIKKEYIVLDFWATWCGPCIDGFRRMKEYYARYGDRIEIAGINTNDSRGNWTGAVERHALPWINLRDPMTKVDLEYGIEALPTKIILDSEYRVVRIFTGEGDDFYMAIDELLKN